jgi:hypothetical protein
MTTLSPARLLAVWESGARRHPIDRALLLYALAAPQIDPEALADRSLGELNAAILALRTAHFGPHLAAWIDCTRCGERMEFELDPAQLPEPPSTAPAVVRVGAHRFLPPTSRRLAITAGIDDAEAATLALMRACIDGEAPPDEALTKLIDAAGEALDAADPWADIALTLPCPACGTRMSASFDIAAYVWDELDTHARALLDDIHLLASAYGWTEPEILALSDTRRAAYLDRVQA